MYEVLIDTNDFLLINKFPGVSFHSETETGLAAQLKADLQLPELYPVHRLDKVTSGLIIFGKTLAFTRHIGAQFENHQVRKLYVALADKRPSKKQGWIKGDMEKGRRGSWKLSSSMTNPAITQFTSASIRAGLRAFFLYPHTGKTHQLRVAMKSLGSPILGDTLYYPKNVPAPLLQTPVERTYLHAAALSFQWQERVHTFVLWPRQGDLFLNINWHQALISHSQPWMTWVLDAIELGHHDQPMLSAAS